ncbi:hypothetical protein CYY_008719 [Polysphondylium violaceum]|uniref:histidine kinase n=1 Tax=Polysphondylium violaceum TaxID=133409 RepID=A0A8J4PL56_9MYCE|nr:hypothetical protein CYY_008719 [Polysphondylium violaceum]
MSSMLEIDNEIEAAEENFKLIADSAPFSLWISGIDKKCFYFNKSWLDFTGRTMDQEVGNGWAEGVHPDDLENCISIYVSFFNARKAFKMEYRLRRYDGVYRWVLDTGCPRFSPSGMFLGFVGSCIDITDMWFAHHEMVNYETQQEEVYKCSQELLDVIKKSNRVANTSNATGINNPDLDFLDHEFKKSILNSVSVSLSSDATVMFQIDAENKFHLLTTQVLENTQEPIFPESLPVFSLPEDFWDSYDRYLAEQESAAAENAANHQGHPMPPPQQSPFFSILFQTYFTPILSHFGVKSLTASVITGFDNKPYGFIVVCSKIEREFSTIEYNSLLSLSNLLSIFVHKSQESKVVSLKNTISSVISKFSSNPILTTDTNGTVIDLNPAAVELLFQPSTPISKSDLSNINIYSLFPLLNSNEYVHSLNNQNQNQNNNESSSTSTSSTSTSTTSSTSTTPTTSTTPQSFKDIVNLYNSTSTPNQPFIETFCQSMDQKIPIQLLIKEISIDSGTSLFLFMLKNLSVLKKVEALEQQLRQTPPNGIAIKDKPIIHNHLSYIIRMSDTLLSSNIPDQHKDSIECIKDLSYLATMTLNQDQQVPQNHETFKLVELLDQAISIISVESLKKSIEFTIQIKKSSLVDTMVQGDRFKILDILINILNGAMDCISEKSMIILSLDKEDEDNINSLTANSKTTTNTANSNNNNNNNNGLEKKHQNGDDENTITTTVQTTVQFKIQDSAVHERPKMSKVSSLSEYYLSFAKRMVDSIGGLLLVHSIYPVDIDLSIPILTLDSSNKPITITTKTTRTSSICSINDVDRTALIITDNPYTESLVCCYAQTLLFKTQTSTLKDFKNHKTHYDLLLIDYNPENDQDKGLSGHFKEICKEYKTKSKLLMLTSAQATFQQDQFGDIDMFISKPIKFKIFETFVNNLFGRINK